MACGDPPLWWPRTQPMHIIDYGQYNAHPSPSLDDFFPGPIPADFVPKIRLTDEDVDRIARRVAELLRDSNGTPQ